MRQMVSAVSAAKDVAQSLHNGGEFPLPLWERVGVRGYGLSIERNPSPGSHLSMRSDLSHKGRGNARSRVRGFNFETALFSAFPRREAPEVLQQPFAPLITEGAGNAGRPTRPQPRVRNKKHTSVVTTVTPEITRHSPRNGFTAYSVLSPASEFLLSPSPAD